MKILSIFAILLFISQSSFASSVETQASLDLTKIKPNVEIGKALNFTILQTLSNVQLEWTGYSESEVCPGNQYERTPDGDLYCTVKTERSWLPQVQVSGRFTAVIQLVTNYGKETRSIDLPISVNANSCVKNFESYRVFSEKAPVNQEANLAVDLTNCSAQFGLSQFVYFQNVPALKMNSLSLDISRDAKIILSQAQLTQLSLNSPVKVLAEQLQMQVRSADEFPALSVSGYLKGNQELLFNSSFIALEYSDK